MRPITRHVLLLTVLLVYPTAAPAQEIGVWDGAGLFKPETIRKANEQIEQIRRRFHTELLIETVKPLSAEQTKQLKGMDSVARGRFFADLAQKQAREAGAKGIYVWISKSPPRAEVVLGPEVAEDRFTPKDAEQLRDRLTGRRFEKQPDRELLRAVSFVHETLDAAGRPMVWPWVLGIIGAVLAVWVVVGLLRSRDQAPGPVGEVSSARVTSGLLGGMFGAAGGLWIHQMLFGQPKAPAAEETPPAVSSEGTGPSDAVPGEPAAAEAKGDFAAEEAEPSESHVRPDGRPRR